MKPHPTREKLVEAARDLFLLRGYHATGIAEIVQRAGARSGSLYYFFPTKEDLLVAVLEWYRDHIESDLLRPVFERVTDPLERIFGLLDGYRQLLLMLEFQHGCPIGNLSLELANSHPTARALLTANFDNWRAAVRACLDEAAARLPEEIDREQLATFVLTVMEGGMMLARTYRSIEPFDAAVHQLRDHFERLLRDGTEWSRPRPVPLERNTE